MFTKSNSPRVAHWCSTFAPSSSTSRLTSRSRSGFDFSVCTPCAVRVESMRYVGIAPPPRSGGRAYNPGGLVEVEERGAEEEDRRDHEHGKKRSRVERDPAAAAQQEEERRGGEAAGDRQRRERAERGHVVGPCQLDRPT